MASGPLSKDVLNEYERNGFVIARGMFDDEEIGLLRRAAKEDRALDQHSFGRGDGEGGTVRLSLWNHPGDTIYGMFARCETIVNTAEMLLDGEVYHYHSKMIMKDPKVGGAWAWHQDYGYWCQNGCMQVLKGSHRMGRIDHVLTGDQAGADMERVLEASKRLELVYVEMDPGDVLFFHSNLLHRSDQNRSEKPRWAMICCYNAARNDPYKEAHHPRYTPLHKVPDSAIKEAGLKRFADSHADVAWL